MPVLQYCVVVKEIAVVGVASYRRPWGRPSEQDVVETENPPFCSRESHHEQAECAHGSTQRDAAGLQHEMEGSHHSVHVERHYPIFPSWQVVSSVLGCRAVMARVRASVVTAIVLARGSVLANARHIPCHGRP
jgi:hypothetical protein